MIDKIAAQVIKHPCSVDFQGRMHYCGKVNNSIYRVILDEDSKKLYKELFDDAEWIVEFFRIGMVPTKIVGETSDGHLVLEHKLFAFQTMFHEWTWEQKKDLAKMIVRLQLHMNKKGCYLSDPHIFNVAFDGAKPVYFDFGSIVRGKYPEHEWVRNFWLAQAWRESWLGCLGISYTQLQDFLRHPELCSVEAQIKNIDGLARNSKMTEWSNYDKHTLVVDKPETWQEKHNAVKDLVAMLPQVPKTAVDIGCNTGDFCKILLKLGVEKVCGIDVDEMAVEALYKEAKEHDLAITPLVSDVIELSGWAAVHFDGDSWARWYNPVLRLNADLAVAVALVHHVCYFRNVALYELARILSDYTKKYLIIEWIPYTDRHLEGPVTRFGQDRAGYTEETFVREFKMSFPTVLGAVLSTDGVRKMFLFSKEKVQ